MRLISFINKSEKGSLQSKILEESGEDYVRW
jgi:hypothetical protein